MKLHLGICRQKTFPSGEAYTNTFTFCGRENSASLDGTNSTGSLKEVTCVHCLNIIKKPWFVKKYGITAWQQASDLLACFCCWMAT